ncbi:MAG TPA: hypothetical protein VL978_12460, partial [Puia sp.]|nr:hypothetical protein [Puia sp.]
MAMILVVPSGNQRKCHLFRPDTLTASISKPAFRTFNPLYPSIYPYPQVPPDISGKKAHFTQKMPTFATHLSQLIKSQGIMNNYELMVIFTPV